MHRVALFVFILFLIIGARVHPLWGDEAETALFARNILKHGVPKGWDGVNIMGINNAVVLNDDLINHTSPWAQYYLTAASFVLFGESSFTARIPSMVFAILTIPLLYMFVLSLTSSKRTASISSGILSCSVPFLLFSFQARYYSLVTMCAVLLAYLSIRKNSWLENMVFVFSGAVFFYGNYVVFALFYAALTAATVVHYRKSVKRLIVLGVAIAFVTAPWMIIMKPFDSRGSIVVPSVIEFMKFWGIFFGMGVYPYILNNVVPVALLLFGFFFRPAKQLWFPLMIVIVFLSFMAGSTVIGDVDTSFVHSRYTSLVIPFITVFVAGVIDRVWQWKRVAGIAVLGVYLTTTIFTISKPRSLIFEYISESLYPYQTPDIAVARYLQEHANQGDTAFVNLDRDHEPLIFHLGETIKFINRVTLVNTRIFPKNRGIIPRYIYDYRDAPDWVILYSKRGNDNTFLTFDYRPLPPEINLTRDYEEIILPVFFADMSRPEIELRSFTGVIPAYEDQVFIYKKK